MALVRRPARPPGPRSTGRGAWLGGLAATPPGRAVSGQPSSAGAGAVTGLVVAARAAGTAGAALGPASPATSQRIVHWPPSTSVTASAQTSGEADSALAWKLCLNVSTSVSPSTARTVASRTSAAMRGLRRLTPVTISSQTRRTAAASSAPGLSPGAGGRSAAGTAGGRSVALTTGAGGAGLAPPVPAAAVSGIRSGTGGADSDAPAPGAADADSGGSPAGPGSGTLLPGTDSGTSPAGVTDAALIDEMCDALAAVDGATVFATVDRVAEAGHDPRRFAADLLERLRDLIVLHQVPDAAAKGLIDAPVDQLERMTAQALRLGPATLSRMADIVHAGLTEMRGTTAPRLHRLRRPSRRTPSRPRLA